jgi:hypothetical protein
MLYGGDQSFDLKALVVAAFVVLVFYHDNMH